MNLITDFLNTITQFSPKHIEAQYYHYRSIGEYTRCTRIRYLAEYTNEDYGNFDEFDLENVLSVNLGNAIDSGRNEYQFITEFNGSMSSNAFVKGHVVELSREYKEY